MSLKNNNKVVDFEVCKSALVDEYELYGILESEVYGKKKYGRKMVSTKRVLVANRMTETEAANKLLFYKALLSFRNDMNRVEKVLSKNKTELEINENMKATYLDAHSDYVL